MVYGVQIQIIGPAAPTRNPGEALIQVHDIEILGLPQNPQHVRILLQQAAKSANADSGISLGLCEQVAKALPISRQLKY
jgi:hypothetical protein